MAKSESERKIDVYGKNEMKCPFYDTEMLQGYLNCGLVIWSTRKHKVSLLPNDKEKYAFRLKRSITSTHYVSSSYCSKCKRMIIDCAEYESNI